MGIRLTHLLTRWGFLAVALLLAAAVGYYGGKYAVADRWTQSSDPQKWERATRLEPGNAWTWYELARFRQFDLEHADINQSLANYHRALDLDPHNAIYWADLAGAYEMGGDDAKAFEAYARAKAAWPASSDVAWRFGNFLLRQGRTAEAYAEIRRALATDPSLGRLAVSRLWQSTRDIQGILDRALPPNVELLLDATAILAQARELDAALTAWKRVAAAHSPVGMPRVVPLVDALIQAERFDDAQRVWGEALESAGWKATPVAPGSLIWDGNFDCNFLNGGLGWQRTETPGAAIEFDTETRHSAKRSLRVTFDGTANADFGGVRQRVPVEPNTRYRLGAFFRAEGITTDSGVNLTVAFLSKPAMPSVSTPGVKGTQDWTLSEAEFTTGPATRVVDVVLRRVPSQKLDNQIAGTVWVDGIALTRLDSKGAGAAR